MNLTLDYQNPNENEGGLKWHAQIRIKFCIPFVKMSNLNFLKVL